MNKISKMPWSLGTDSLVGVEGLLPLKMKILLVLLSLVIIL